MHATIEILSRDNNGLAVLMRALHVLAGITWIGLLYYFNVVQTPALAAYGDEARARSVTLDKLARRALWWFRWSALTTLILGLLITGATKELTRPSAAPAARALPAMRRYRSPRARVRRR